MSSAVLQRFQEDPDHHLLEERGPPPPSLAPQNAEDLMEGRRRDDPPIIQAVRMHTRDQSQVQALLEAGGDANTTDKVRHAPRPRSRLYSAVVLATPDP